MYDMYVGIRARARVFLIAIHRVNVEDEQFDMKGSLPSKKHQGLPFLVCTSSLELGHRVHAHPRTQDPTDAQFRYQKPRTRSIIEVDCGEIELV